MLVQHVDVSEVPLEVGDEQGVRDAQLGSNS